ncbi:hypothetical protein PAESOLCIP111_06311 [Paenibacillus solanacearum]|uniref:S-layer homology domain-containing protein n=2 Tax=Paenibacillus solanacearum TaxID=2048548 RepID=A0A916K7Q3_9BACL|nr:hypothetical protein PAESOLCIP111_06311 [Paenibacillus solanacearum]
MVLFVIAACMMFPKASFAFSGSGAGTKLNPYIITTPAQLNEIKSSSGSYYVLGQDIDLTGIPWSPIPTFSGTLDGRGYAIRNMTIVTSTEPSGFIASSSLGAVVRNVGFENVNLTGNSTSAGAMGAVIGTLNNNGTVENVYVTGSIDTLGRRVGGIVGQIQNGGTIRNAYSRATVSATSNTGGIVGYTQSTSNNIHIDHVYATGGISYKTGGGNAGGLLGNVLNAYVTDAYWNTSSTGTSKGIGLFYTVTDSSQGLTDAAMKTQSSYAGWDFQSIWKMSSTYPVFRKMAASVSADVPDGKYRQGAAISIEVTFNDTVSVTGTPAIELNSGGRAAYAGGNGTDTLTFLYTVQEGDTSAKLNYLGTGALLLQGGTIQDSEGDDINLLLPDTATGLSLANRNIVIKTDEPYVTGVTTSLPDAAYALGASIPVLVQWNKPVTVTGTPSLKLNTGRYAYYTGGSGTNTLLFQNTVALNDQSALLDYDSAAALELNGGAIKDSLNNQAFLGLPSPGNAGSLSAGHAIVIDTTADQTAINTVIALIAALPDKASVTLSDAAAVMYARQQYDGLSAVRRAQVTNVTRLTEAEAALVDLHAAKTVQDAIAALPAKAAVTLADEAAVMSARQQYNALSSAQQALVPNVTRLTEAEAALADLHAAKTVQDAIAALPAKAAVTLADEAAVTSARQQYNALSAAQQALVPNVTRLAEAEAALVDLHAAKTVQDLVAALPARAAVTLADEAAVTSARQQYNALSGAQQALVPNVARLTEAEAALVDLHAAKTVQDMIAALPAKAAVTLADEAAVTSARQQYNALSGAQQALVTNVTRLTEAEAALADLHAAKTVQDMIAALPAKAAVTLADEAAVTSTRQQYNALSGAQQALVPNLTRLTEAESALVDLHAAKTVQDMIATLPTKTAVTLADEAAVTSARQQYNALSAAQQALVPNVTRLTEAEAALMDLHAAKTVQDLVAALPAKASVTLADEAAVTSARQQYNALSSAQQALVPNVMRLTEAESALVDLHAAKTVQDMIAALPAKSAVTLADEAAVTSVRQQYNALSAAQQALVPNVARLTEAEAALVDLHAAKTVQDMIAALPAKTAVTLADEAAVTSARQQYNALSSVQQALVVNVTRLTEAETAIQALHIADASRSGIVASPAAVPAGGTEASLVTVTLRNAHDNPLSGKQVRLTVSAGARAVVAAVYDTTNADGHAAFKVTNTAAESVTITAENVTDQITLAQTATISFIAGGVSLPNSTVTASTYAVPADGVTPSRITVTLKDAYDNPLLGRQVRLKASGGSSVIAAVYDTTNADGQAAFHVTNAEAEKVMYTAEDVTDRMTLNEAVSVTFVTGEVSTVHSAVTASSYTVPADGTTPSRITVTLKDVYGHPLPGRQVRLTAAGGSSVIASVYDTTNANGQAAFHVTNIAAEQVTYAAEDVADRIRINQTADIRFIYGIPPAILLHADPLEATYGEVTVTVTAAAYGERNAIAVLKWANGTLPASYFAGNGSELNNGRFTVRENGTYTVYVKDIAGNENTSGVTIANILALSRDARLSRLQLSGLDGELSPSFDAGITGYEAFVSHRVASVTVTAWTADANAAVTVNGQPVRSGEASPPIPLADGVNTITISVTAQDGSTNGAYTVTVVKAAEPVDDTSLADDSEPSYGGDRETPVKPVDPNAARMSINGQQYEGVVKTVHGDVGGRSTVTVAFEPAMREIIERTEQQAIVTIVVPSDADDVTVELDGEIVKRLASKQAVLELQTAKGAYRLPASEISMERLAAMNGAGGEPTSLQVRITIAAGPEYKITRMQNHPDNHSIHLVAPPVDFTVTAAWNGTPLTVDTFDSFVERSIVIPDEAEPGMIATAVVMNEEGTVRHVPTYETELDGRRTAVIRSLTNSTYALVSHRPSLTDIEGHWAQPSITGLASRLIVQGGAGGRFHPDSAITRAEFAALAVRALGLPENGSTAAFGDVERTDWFYGAVSEAYAYGLIAGYADGTFRPEKTITREEAWTIIARAMKLVGLNTRAGLSEGSLSQTPGYEDISSWAVSAAAAAAGAGLIGGDEQGWSPGRPITRAETAAIMERMLIKSGYIRP